MTMIPLKDTNVLRFTCVYSTLSYEIKRQFTVFHPPVNTETCRHGNSPL